ncbi:MAG: radical SAM family heme chaperone HemW [Oscillospiraceae bacterium]|nr:radical SAM family heme chaperone HemW [Oscillospiraceae bacterium]
MNKIGLYLHIPFCRSKCPYCDFYSFPCKDDGIKDAYCAALRHKMSSSSTALQRKSDTLYIGGGTPSVLGAKRLASLVNTAKSAFLTDDAEITVECNPYGLDEDFFKELAFSGVNRISMGLQSADDGERRILGRRADIKTVESDVKSIREAGIKNISLDVMLGIPKQTEKTLAETLSFCISSGVPHISAYILKLEENTPFYKNRGKLDLPNDDLTADLYLQMCEALTKGGLSQYEISNFARAGYESRHNLKYWHCEEYLGLGAAAHSYIHGKRFYYERDLEGFISGVPPVPDGDGGDFTEYAMLALRLAEGLCENNVLKRFGHKIPNEMREKACIFVNNGYMESDENGLRLTRKGFLLSNSILAEIL